MYSRVLAILMLLGLGLLPAAGQAEEEKKIDRMELSSAQFLQWARHPPLSDSWVKMSGEMMNRSEGKTYKKPVEFRARMDPKRIIGQFIFDDNQERYGVSQVFADGRDGMAVIAERQAPAGVKSIADFGIRPTDLTLSFLYWDFEEELAPANHRTLKCRVFTLSHPGVGETATVYISVNYLFPVKVVWRQDGNDAPIRQLEFTNFKEGDDGVWIINEAVLRGDGWKTQLRFSNVELEQVNEEKPVPADLFVTD